MPSTIMSTAHDFMDAAWHQLDDVAVVGSVSDDLACMSADMAGGTSEFAPDYKELAMLAGGLAEAHAKIEEARVLIDNARAITAKAEELACLVLDIDRGIVSWDRVIDAARCWA